MEENGTAARTNPKEHLYERLYNQGVRALQDHELVAVVLCQSRQCCILKLAQRVMDLSTDHLFGLGQHSPWDLLRIPGITRRNAAALVAAMELGRRRHALSPKRGICVSSSAMAYELLKAPLQDLPNEELWVLMLDRANRLIGRERVSIGGLHGTVADPKMIFRAALERRASFLILSHNHPSGQLYPSEEDIRLTKKLVEAGKVLDIVVQDHIIVAGDSYYSFADQEMI